MNERQFKQIRVILKKLSALRSEMSDLNLEFKVPVPDFSVAEEALCSAIDILQIIPEGDWL